MGKNSKERLLEIAFRLFVANHYEVVSIKDIEEASKMSRGTIFYHVENKKDLFQQAIDKYVFEKQDITSKIEATFNLSLYDFINVYSESLNMTMASLNDIIKDLTECNISKAYLSLILNTGRYYKDFDEKITKTFHHEIFLWSYIIENAKRSGEIRNDIDSKILAEQFRCMFVGKFYNDSLKKNPDIAHLKIMLLGLYNLIKA
jgi:hypothetical protein